MRYVWLVVDVTGETRLAKRDPTYRLYDGAVAFKLALRFPGNWGRVINPRDPIALDVPEGEFDAQLEDSVVVGHDD